MSTISVAIQLSPSKMRNLMELKYNTIGDAVEVFGSPAAIRETFIGFQKCLYER
ncbi:MULTISPECIES: hypothetical protein [Shewanella]|uniref:hypothetical protein n=1 Tax=Shewanella TaxID=22 RepID=UPI0013A07D92|nr:MULTISPECIES: hypothetical protein [Shewanella]MDN5500121.1 hypothetical protein [Shewanella sp.]